MFPLLLILVLVKRIWKKQYFRTLFDPKILTAVHEASVLSSLSQQVAPKLGEEGQKLEKLAKFNKSSLTSPFPQLINSLQIFEINIIILRTAFKEIGMKNL
jgi:hypothetical protein